MTNLSGKNIENSNIEKKISLYSKAFELDSEDVNAMKALAFCYKDLGKFELAIKYFSLARRKAPFDRVLYYELGLLECLKKNFIRAIRLFMKAIRLSPDYIDAILAMAAAHVEIEEYDMAEMIYLKILEKTPYNTDVYSHLGYLYIKTCDWKKALNCFREILIFDKDNAQAYLGLAKCFDGAGKMVEARRYYKKYCRLAPFSAEKKFVLSRLENMSMPKKNSTTDKSYLRLV